MKTNKAKTLAALAIIAAANPDGYTVAARALQPITTGYAVAETGAYYYDGTIVVDSLVGAMEIARLNKQFAISDLTNCAEIRIK